MKIAYAALYDVLNQASWPSKHQAGIYGSGYYLANALTEESVFIDYLGPLKEKKSVVTSLKFHVYHHLFGKKYYSWAEPLILNDFATRISRKLSKFNSDLVLCPINVVPIAKLECHQPIVLWTDATLDLLIDDYPFLTNLCEETIKNIYAMEQSALDKCKMVIYTSDWAAQGAIKTYGIDPSKVKVIPWGANIECNRTFDDIYSLVKCRNSKVCKLLFIGVDWVRKGGNVAFDVAKELNKLGLNTELTIVGCEPILDEPIPSFVKSLGYVDKSTKEGSEKMEMLFAESHFLILPTVADCTPFVIAEANSFGVPCLATDVGGITTMIRDNFNGKVFSKNANINEYCIYVLHLFSNQKQNEKLALSSFNEYQTRLNWKVAAQTAKNLFLDLV